MVDSRSGCRSLVGLVTERSVSRPELVSRCGSKEAFTNFIRTVHRGRCVIGRSTTISSATCSPTSPTAQHCGVPNTQPEPSRVSPPCRHRWHSAPRPEALRRDDHALQRHRCAHRRRPPRPRPCLHHPRRLRALPGARRPDCVDNSGRASSPIPCSFRLGFFTGHLRSPRKLSLPEVLIPDHQLTCRPSQDLR